MKITQILSQFVSKGFQKCFIQALISMTLGLSCEQLCFWKERVFNFQCYTPAACPSLSMARGGHQLGCSKSLYIQGCNLEFMLNHHDYSNCSIQLGGSQREQGRAVGNQQTCDTCCD